jgi:zinc protease
MTTLQASRLWTGSVRREILPNGLTLLVQRDDSAPAVAVVTHVKAGFFDEPDKWVGISHVLEHMFFKGTPTRGVGRIARDTKAAGGYLNASTSYDKTSYFVVLPATALREAIDVQADALRNSSIDEAELRRELQVIIQEARRKLDSPDAVAYETLHELMFDRHRIRRWRIGTEQQLAGYKRADVHGYYASRYVPGRTIVSVVGAVDEDDTLALLREMYGTWAPADGADDPSPPEPERDGVRARTLRGDVSRAELALGWRTVPPLHDDAVALDLAAAVLTSGRGSWLYRALREPGVVTGVGATNYAPTELGVFTITADLEPTRVDAALTAIAQAVARMALLGPTADDMQRARTLLQARWARQMESMEGRASSIASAEALGRLELLDEEYDRLGTVSADEVREAVRRYLVPELVSGVLYLPEGTGEDLTSDHLARAFAVTALAPETPAPAPPTWAPTASRPVRGASTGSVLHVPLPGLDLLVRRKGGVPAVYLGYYVPRAVPEPAGQGGVAALAMRSVARGAGSLDARALAFAAEGLGGTLGTSAGIDWTSLTLPVLSDNLVAAARLLRLAGFEPALRDDDVLAERGLLLDEARVVADDMFRYPFQLALGAAFGDHGYGVPMGGTLESLGFLTPELARAWHRTQFTTTRGVLVAVGDLDPDDAASHLAGVFEDLPPAAAPAAAPVQHVRPPAEGWQRVVERAKAQSAFAMAFPGPSRRSPSGPAAEVWTAVASGLGGRLFESLRDKRSLAYTVVGASWARRDGGAMLAYIATSPTREEEARAAMLEELRRFAEEPVSAAELELGVNYLAGQAEVRRQSAGAVAGEMVDAWLVGRGLGELDDPAARYRAVTQEEIREVCAAAFLGPRAEGVVRGSEA